MIEFACDNPEQYRKAMKRISWDDSRLCWTGTVAFGKGWAIPHASPSRIPYLAVGDSPRSCRGYWESGVFRPFPARLLLQYQNAATGCE